MFKFDSKSSYHHIRRYIGKTTNFLGFSIKDKKQNGVFV
jgi:uncharacterized membrane protein YcgQ (UPF0703/DUF1980 family)